MHLPRLNFLLCFLNPGFCEPCGVRNSSPGVPCVREGNVTRRWMRHSKRSIVRFKVLEAVGPIKEKVNFPVLEELDLRLRM